ncbi:MAG: hypothetical protein K2R93_02250 [Gemmatimonadaceae bacterium]|nr:hypothetical protein [Gemmatimonadaceae bacterium]
MRSPDALAPVITPRVGRALLAKDWRTLRHSRAWLLVALAIGPFVGLAWREAASIYTEMSGTPGDAAAALAGALSPLDGIVAPVLGAYAVIATLLLPFVAIRTVAAEKASGAHGLLLQTTVPLWRQVLSRFAALLGTWALWLIPGVLLLLVWRARGGHLDATETAGVLLGHLLHGAFVAALGLASAAITESAASAAVVALAVTLGAWAVDFTASVRGGLAAVLAPYTPDAMLRSFEHGLVVVNEVAVALVLIGALLALTVIWLESAQRRARALQHTGVVLLASALLLPLAARLHGGRDLSEDRRNSFAPADEQALAAITQPLTITVHLGPSDPRRADLERGVLQKLVRTMPHVTVQYAAQSSTGLFAGNEAHYGEIWYELGGAKEASRSTVPNIVLETIYQLAKVAPPTGGAPVYPGYPSRITASLWEMLLCGIGWPAFVAAAWWRRRQ